MVIVYGKENCAQCKMTKTVMQREGIDFVEKNIEKDDNSLEYLKSLNIRTVPFVETENDSWLGFNPAKIRALKA